MKKLTFRSKLASGWYKKQYVAVRVMDKMGFCSASRHRGNFKASRPIRIMAFLVRECGWMGCCSLPSSHEFCFPLNNKLTQMNPWYFLGFHAAIAWSQSCRVEIPKMSQLFKVVVGQQGNKFAKTRLQLPSCGKRFPTTLLILHPEPRFFNLSVLQYGQVSIIDLALVFSG